VKIFQLFLEFILTFLELILFTKRLQNLFHELQILYLDCSCPNLSLVIFLKFWEFCKYFSGLEKFPGFFSNQSVESATPMKMAYYVILLMDPVEDRVGNL
jgi:hypothetical protein